MDRGSYKGPKAMTAPNLGRCVERVHDNCTWPSFHQCRRMAAVTESGKPWCKQHAPSTKATRRQASQERWEQRRKMQNTPYTEIQRLRKALKRIAGATPGDKELMRRIANEALAGDGL